MSHGSQGQEARGGVGVEVGVEPSSAPVARNHLRVVPGGEGNERPVRAGQGWGCGRLGCWGRDVDGKDGGDRERRAMAGGRGERRDSLCRVADPVRAPRRGGGRCSACRRRAGPGLTPAPRRPSSGASRGAPLARGLGGGGRGRGTAPGGERVGGRRAVGDGQWARDGLRPDAGQSRAAVTGEDRPGSGLLSVGGEAGESRAVRAVGERRSRHGDARRRRWPRH